MRTKLYLLLPCILLCCAAKAQTPYPPRIVEGVTWTSGTQDIRVPAAIISPYTPTAPVSISNTAQVDFVSGSEVHLKDGFHAAAFSGSGYFHAFTGPSADMILISPDPQTNIIDDVLHVNKWEKLEIGINLPGEYDIAIANFFSHYYSNGVTNAATPGNVDPDHDLNPYADDSLQMYMILTSPSGQKMKWGFYMKEGKWGTTDDSKLTLNTGSDFYLHNARFRIAPNEEGTWYFSINITAPYTENSSNVPLAPIQFTGFSFVCDAPLTDNKGYLNVNQTNKRMLQFDNGDPFFGLGVNMADIRHDYFATSLWGNYFDFYRRDFDVMKQTMEDLHSVDGNFLRMWFFRHIFAPEWVNLGVYDAYVTPEVCSMNELTANPNLTDPNCTTDVGWTHPYAGNCQYQCWAFDQMVEHARANNIYIQLCVEPSPPTGTYEKFIWGANSYVINFLEPTRQGPNNMYDLKEYFYSSGVNNPLTEGVFYYWKRKYKYIMSRWGYSVNIAAVEVFNEIDQTLSFQNNDYRNYHNGNPINSTNCNDWDENSNPNGIRNKTVCPENRFNYTADPNLKTTFDDWLTDIISYVKDPVNFSNPAASPLGEDKRLFLLSYTGALPPTAAGASADPILRNPKLDLIDVHSGLYEHLWDVEVSAANAAGYRDNFTNSSTSEKKPFHHGEYSTPGLETIYGPFTFQYSTSQLFDNYKISFHNEIWASAFFGNFASGSSWGWDRVFWWPDALAKADIDASNPYWPTTQFPNAINQPCSLALNIGGTPTQHIVNNEPLYQHFQPLANFLNNSTIQSADFFNNDFTPRRTIDFDVNDNYECYYLVNADQTMAIGWVHKLNNYFDEHWYYNYANQHYLDCAGSSANTISLPGFSSSDDYDITYYPTHPNSTIAPNAQTNVTPNGSGDLQLNLSSASLNGILNNDLDYFHSDYAFIAVGSSFVPRMDGHSAKPDETINDSEIDFTVYPNPNDKLFNILMPLKDNSSKDITIYDLTGRTIYAIKGILTNLHSINASGFAKGVYYVKVRSISGEKVKRIIVQ